MEKKSTGRIAQCSTEYRQKGGSSRAALGRSGECRNGTKDLPKLNATPRVEKCIDKHKSRTDMNCTESKGTEIQGSRKNDHVGMLDNSY